MLALCTGSSRHLAGKGVGWDGASVFWGEILPKDLLRNANQVFSYPLLGKPVYTKIDEFSENFQMAFDPPAPFSGKMMQFFL